MDVAYSVLRIPIPAPLRELQILQQHHRWFTSRTREYLLNGNRDWRKQEYHTEHKLYHPELMNQVKAH